MDDGSKKSEKATTSLSIDRAAFLILRVKKAFKKKRQQRKDRQAAQQAAALAANTNAGDRKGPPPLLRSRTLPSIIVPGIAILQNQIDSSRLVPGDGYSGINFAARLSLQPRPSRSSIVNDDNSFEYRRKSSGGSHYSVSSTNNNADPYVYSHDDIERYPDGTVVLRIPAPHVVAARAYRMSSSAGLLGVGCISSSSSTSHQFSSSNASSSQEKTPLYRLAKLLNQNIKPTQCPILKDDTPRRLSWERRENAANNRLPRSASIDSMVEAVWSESSRPSLTVEPPESTSYRQNIQTLTISNESTSRRESLLSPSSGRRTKQHRGINSLFAAVENGHLDKARTILESTDVDVNSLNSDGLSPLDVAVLSNNRSLTKMLLQHGAIEGTQFKNSESLGNHLNSLLHDAENRIHELGSGAEDISQPPFSTRASFSSIIGNAYPGTSVTGCAGNEADKQIGIWERRVKGLRRMLLGWDQARPPDPPYCTTIDVTSINSVTIRIQESTDGAITTKFKIQWSTRCDFSNIVGDREVNEWNSFQGIMGSTCRISDLTQGRRYFFRACCGNVKGWGQYRQSIPNSVIPSSWRDIEHRESRFAGRQRILDDLFTAVRLARPDDASEIQVDTPALQRRNPKKKTTIKQLFSAASKFQKNLKRGIYLACILYHEDKVLVTNEDFVPVVEIDETYPSCLHNDYNWLMKVACTWDDVKSLRNDMVKNPTSADHFRTKLLSAVYQMQYVLGIQDLGQLYHKPLRDSLGTIVLSCINNVKSSKSVSVLNSRWIPLNKIQKKLIAIHEDNNINEILLSSIQDQISYHQSSSFKLARGLYIGYLKMQSSVDQIQIVVPTKTPNVLPHCKIRDNPHISAEEWDFLRPNKAKSSYEMAQNEPTDVQELFLEALIHATHRIFKHMEISPEHALTHRLYNFEVMELSPEVSFLIICPPAELSCAVPGQREILLQRGDLLSLPIQVFEMVHLKTYHIGIIQKYSRLSCILELDTVLANHFHRQAFSTIELQAAKERLNKLQNLTKSLNEVWKGARWLMDVISFARDRCSYLGLSMKEILEIKPTNCEYMNEDVTSIITNKLHLLQPPTVRDNKLAKGLPGRGSWPGPTNLLGGNGLLVAEHSKSEQQLSLTMSNLGSRYLSTASEFDNSRKNSADSNYSHSGNSYYSAGEPAEAFVQRLPPSRSEDTLTVSKHSPPSIHRKRSITVNASMTNSNPSPVKDAQPKGSDTEHSYSNQSSITSTPTHKSKSLRESIRTSKPSTSAAVENYLERSTSSKASKTKDLMKEDLHISEGDLTNAGTSSSQAGTLTVYAAYKTGLAVGVNLTLHVTTATTAREVINLVVKQLNVASVLKGRNGPVYTGAELDSFCLVAVIGARERCLRDDFRPLQLQNPWKKGRLYVRQKHELLAAIQHSNTDAQLI